VRGCDAVLRRITVTACCCCCGRRTQNNPSEKSLEFGRDFRVLHYAGEVTYCVIGFIDKNKDTLFQDFKRLLYNRSAAVPD